MTCTPNMKNQTVHLMQRVGSQKEIKNASNKHQVTFYLQMLKNSD